jgi:PKD repeat protein
MKINTLHLLITIAIIFTSCDNNSEPEAAPTPMPEASFSIDLPVSRILTGVRLTNTSDTANIKEYIWKYKDAIDTIRSLKTPFITYEKPGNYQVKLIAVTNDNKKDSTINDIKIGDNYISAIRIANLYKHKWDVDEEGENVNPDIQVQLVKNDEILWTSFVIPNLNPDKIWENAIPTPLTKFNGGDYKSDVEIQIYDIDDESKELIFSTNQDIKAFGGPSYDEQEQTGNYYYYSNYSEVQFDFVVF